MQDSVSEMLLQLDAWLRAWSISEFLEELVAAFSLPRCRDWPSEWLLTFKLGLVLEGYVLYSSEL